MHAEVGVVTADQLLHNLKADVMAGTNILRAGITKAHNKKRGIIHVLQSTMSRTWIGKQRTPFLRWGSADVIVHFTSAATIRRGSVEK